MEQTAAEAQLSTVQSFEDKLSLIDQEIRTLHQFCITKGFSPHQVEESAKPILKHLREVRRQHWKNVLMRTAVIVTLVAALTYCDPAVKFASACGRLAMIKMLPYWDWTRYYNDDGCLLDNPYFKGDVQELLPGDCEICENTESVIRLTNVSQVTVAEAYIKRDIPVIVTDGTIGWSAGNLFSIQFLYQLYSEDEVLRNAPTCMFASNVRVTYGGARLFLSKVYRSEYSNWYAHWEECEMSAVRVLRQFFKRPYFIPQMVETAKLNWLLLSSNYNAKNYKPVDLGTSVTWFAQVKGKNRIRLVPRTPCNSTCSILYTVLHEGEIIMWTDFLWLLDYQPLSSGVQLNVAIAAGGFYD